MAKIRIGDKVNRAKNLLILSRPVPVNPLSNEQLCQWLRLRPSNESIRDTFIDMANYCAMTAAWMKANRKLEH